MSLFAHTKIYLREILTEAQVLPRWTQFSRNSHNIYTQISNISICFRYLYTFQYPWYVVSEIWLQISCFLPLHNILWATALEVFLLTSSFRCYLRKRPQVCNIYIPISCLRYILWNHVYWCPGLINDYICISIIFPKMPSDFPDFFCKASFKRISQVLSEHNSCTCCTTTGVGIIG